MFVEKDRVKNATGVIRQEGVILKIEGPMAKIQWESGFVNWWRAFDLELVARNKDSDQAAIEALL